MNSVKLVNIQLNPAQIEYLRGVIYEYYNTCKAPYQDEYEQSYHQQLEDILADAETQAYSSN